MYIAFAFKKTSKMVCSHTHPMDPACQYPPPSKADVKNIIVTPDQIQQIQEFAATQTNQ